MALRALLVRKRAIQADRAMLTRGTRKIVVTGLYPDKEEDATDPVWEPEGQSGKCPVLVSGNLEMCIFNERVPQGRHYHRNGIEIYMVMEGTMKIEVEGRQYCLEAGDTIVVASGSEHQVDNDGGPFLCRVVTANCGGVADKFPAETLNV
jgi:mannose-6-phosphate isomerase-like protein (cupin superfamily)